MLIGVSFFPGHKFPSSVIEVRKGNFFFSTLATSDQQPTFQMPTIVKWLLRRLHSVLAPISFTPIVEFIYQLFRFSRPLHDDTRRRPRGQELPLILEKIITRSQVWTTTEIAFTDKKSEEWETVMNCLENLG